MCSRPWQWAESDVWTLYRKAGARLKLNDPGLAVLAALDAWRDRVGRAKDESKACVANATCIGFRVYGIGYRV